MGRGWVLGCWEHALGYKVTVEYVVKVLIPLFLFASFFEVNEAVEFVPGLE